MSNFPTYAINRKEAIEDKEIPLLKEYAWNFENDNFLFDENGKFIILDGLEALKVRNYLSLKIYKDRWFIYNGKVGGRIKELIGKGYSFACLHAQEFIEEAIVDNIYVNSIEDLEITMKDNKVIINFNVNSIYGSYSESIKGVEV